MSIEALKLRLIRQVIETDSEESLHWMLDIFDASSAQNVDQWDDLTPEQQQGLLDAIESLDRGEGIPHEVVMAEIRAMLKHWDDQANDKHG